MSLYEKLATAVFGPEYKQEVEKNPRDKQAATDMLKENPQAFSNAVLASGQKANMGTVSDKMSDIEMYQKMVLDERMKLDVESIASKGIKPIDVKDLSIHAAELMANIGATFASRATLDDAKHPTGNGSTLAENAKNKSQQQEFNPLTGKKEGGFELA